VSLPSSANQPAVSTQKPGTNVYTVMLIMAFLAIVTACILLSVELGRFGFPQQVPWNTPGGS
jgi:hypothetical protein